MNEIIHLTPDDPRWPAGLRRMSTPPSDLWCLGDLSLLHEHGRTAVIGARASTAYGDQVASGFGASLAGMDQVVVSGAAYGIDAAAHRGALSVAGGKTIAVLAGGVDVPYPRANSNLIESIAERGLLVSPYPPGRSPARHQFLYRNGVLVALSDRVVVVEAGLRSGSLNAASQAEQMNIPVFAVPGPVTSVNSQGTHDLIWSRRARLATCAEDVL